MPVKHNPNDIVSRGAITMDGTTEVAESVTKPDARSENPLYLLHVTNLDTVRTVTVTARNVHTPVATERKGDLASFTVLPNTGTNVYQTDYLLEGFLVGSAGEIGFVYNGANSATTGCEFELRRV